LTEIPRSDITKNSFGGTELMAIRLFESLPKGYIDDFQIILTRLTEELDPTKIRILWVHDLPDDPQLKFLENDGWRKFHMIVFVSNWQMQSFIYRFNIPWEKCLVIQNAIQIFNKDVIENKPKDKINLIYTPTPHRGLEILIPVFQKLKIDYDNLHLDVFSSFNLYGWGDRDKEYQQLFDICESDPNITYHGSKPNADIRIALGESHIFAYPSIWVETSSICLIEAMSAGLLCVHPNLGALYETASNFTYMYQFNEDKNKHANLFYAMLKMSIENYLHDDNIKLRLMHQKMYADQVYNWDIKKVQWKSFMDSLLKLPREIEDPSKMFIYKR
jgi:UDP-glucose:(glucosyl)LPS alpha-1,2-glucosyltransferase